MRFCFSICSAISSGGVDFADREQAAVVQRCELVAGRGDDPLDRIGKRTRANGRPVVVSKADAAAHKVIGDLQIIIVRTIQVGKVNRGRIGEGKVADRIKLGQDNHRAPIPDLCLHRRGGIGCDEERSKGAQESRGGDVKLGFEFIEMLVAAFAGGQVHEIPGKERIGQGQVGVDARGGKRVAVQVNAFFEIAALGNAPTAWDGIDDQPRSGTKGCHASNAAVHQS